MSSSRACYLAEQKRARRHGHRGSVGDRHMRQGVRPCAGVVQEHLPPSQHYCRQLGRAADTEAMCSGVRKFWGKLQIEANNLLNRTPWPLSLSLCCPSSRILSCALDGASHLRSNADSARAAFSTASDYLRSDALSAFVIRATAAPRFE
jgi:hypothetical protein